ncbi:putative oxidoreductase YteT isoform X3 [Crassostrea angulata]|uniref:putative oxidoreductase YteT isoform X3 n=1 Tax=Magallana angulata TaxID=2784310 RepID=UPI0022B1137E|nr:putative oxidoreductase YteT isoform X3 [Crassostrea angulata]
MDKLLQKLSKMFGNKKNKTTAIVIGAGMRGYGYSYYQRIKPDRFRVIAVADPKKYQREKLQTLCGISDDMAFKDWREVVEREKFAECVIICTQDKLHKEPTVAFAKKGYHILLEKPMATTEEDCREIVRVCKENNVFLTVCHVLRYTPWVRKIKELIDSGAIGDVVNIQHLEPVGYWHFAHSYVRGNWHNESESSPSLLAKCCHDVDLVCHWMGERKCQRVSSFGHLSHFNKENKPKKAANRCLECPKELESKCPYSAKKIYIEDGIKASNTGWPVFVLTAGPPDIENVTEALRTGPYGRCVYDMDNDVMSQQVVNMQFTVGATASLSMIGFTGSVCTREVNVFGTKGEIRYKDGDESVSQVDFTTRRRYKHKLESKSGPLSGHGGGDQVLIESFVSAIYHKDFSKIDTGADETLASHLVVFAAEKARKENRVVTINEDMSFE